MSTNPTKRIEEIDRRLEELPKGTLTYKKIKGKGVASYVLSILRISMRLMIKNCLRQA